jgi:RNA polymerase sigma-70 factor (ECF subfamily)
MMRSVPTRADDPGPEPRSAAQAAALEAIFRASYDELYATVYRYLPSRALAEEVVQDVFLTMWERRDRWGEGELTDLRRYLFAAVQNRALSRLRRERVESTWREGAMEGRRDSGVGHFTATAGAPSERSELVERLEQAIAALPDRARETLLLRVRRQLQNAEIAEVMGISVKAVEGNLARAMHALRVALGPRL